MKYGCIGEHLGHSFSREIHRRLSDYEYELCEVERDALDGFMQKRDFKAINVTIPYKEAVIPHLYEIDGSAKAIGAVNTVVNRDGKLYGYNTDFYGMSELIRHAGVEIEGKKVAILGTGGTSKTARAVIASLGAGEILTVSRTAGNGAIDYESLHRAHTDVEVIINTTPVGMFQDSDGVAVELASFPRLSGVIDAVYNPLRTRLVMEARARGAAAEGGLYMLVAQAVRASEIFLDCTYPEGTTEKIFREMMAEKENIVLIGMPASGKTTVGRLLSDMTWREVVDIDELVVSEVGYDIPTIFEREGEGAFRLYEERAITGVATCTGIIIATGGGAILNAKNIERLRRNGRVYFIDRPLEYLIPTADRPLSQTKEAIERRYRERYSIYSQLCDVRIDADCSAEEVAEKIMEDFSL